MRNILVLCILAAACEGEPLATDSLPLVGKAASASLRCGEKRDIDIATTIANPLASKTVVIQGKSGERFALTNTTQSGSAPIISVVGPQGTDKRYVTQNRHNRIQGGVPYTDEIRGTFPTTGNYEVNLVESHVDFRQGDPPVARYQIALDCSPPPYLSKIDCDQKVSLPFDFFHEKNALLFVTDQEHQTLSVALEIGEQAPQTVEVLTFDANSGKSGAAVKTTVDDSRRGGLAVTSVLDKAGAYLLVLEHQGRKYSATNLALTCN